MRVNKYARPRLSARTKTLFLLRTLSVFIVSAILFISISAWLGKSQKPEQTAKKTHPTTTLAYFNSTVTDSLTQKKSEYTAPTQSTKQSTLPSTPQTPPNLSEYTNVPPELALKMTPLDSKTAYPAGILNDAIIFDSLKLKKSERKLYAMQNGSIKRVYSVALGESPKGHRTILGDKKTPEGRYSIIAKENLTEYHKSLRLSYPNASDILTAQELGKTVGTHIFIHGLPPEFAFLDATHKVSDWTNGSIAVTNAEIDELYKHLRLGAPIIIEP